MELIYCSTKPDAKYKPIYDKLDFNFRYINHGKLFKKLITLKLNGRVSHYHLRYLHLDHWAKFLFYLTLPVLLKINNVNLVWSIHNVYDHKTKIRPLNYILDLYLIIFSSACIVFHEDIKLFFPALLQNNISVAGFGPLTPQDVSSEIETDHKNIKLAKSFLSKRESKPVLVSISTATHNKAFRLAEYLDKDVLMIYVDPNGSFSNDLQSSKNLLYIQEKVGIKFLAYLKTLQYPIGVIGHDNLSVATSLYMFTTMGFPVISFNYPPNSTIVKENKIGALIESEMRIEEVAENIKQNYTNIQKNIDVFLEENTWEKSIRIHKKIFN